MKKNILIGSSLAISLLAGGIYARQALAYRGDPLVKGPNYSVERHEEMEKALETKNYEAWKSLMMGRGRVTQVVNKENFARFALAHRLTESGKIQEANAIRAELGLGLQNGTGQGRGWGRNR